VKISDRKFSSATSVYRLRVVSVMGEVLPSKKTAALEKLAEEAFGELRFDALQDRLGIVGTRWEDDRPIIFRTNPIWTLTSGGYPLDRHTSSHRCELYGRSRR
jgi:hypothetical protein